MVASRTSPFVPTSFLLGTSCLWPARPEAVADPAARSRLLPDAELTPAERRVCDLLLTGLSNKEIANELNRSEATIKNQVSAILRKYGVCSRTRLLAWRR
jgi:DNA-binding NarL/FixJ family response regulator